MYRVTMREHENDPTGCVIDVTCYFSNLFSIQKHENTPNGYVGGGISQADSACQDRYGCHEEC
jgi:hypothetical protein